MPIGHVLSITLAFSYILAATLKTYLGTIEDEAELVLDLSFSNAFISSTQD